MQPTAERTPDPAIPPFAFGLGAEPTPLMKDVVIGRGTSWAMLCVFVVLIGIPVIHQVVVREEGRFRGDP